MTYLRLRYYVYNQSLVLQHVCQLREISDLVESVVWSLKSSQTSMGTGAQSPQREGEIRHAEAPIDDTPGFGARSEAPGACAVLESTSLPGCSALRRCLLKGP